jgi:hypothetical protein
MISDHSRLALTEARSLDRAVAVLTTATRSFGSLLGRHFNGVRRAIEAAQAHDLLWHQSDAELARRGLSRGQVTRAIFDKYYNST